MSKRSRTDSGAAQTKGSTSYSKKGGARSGLRNPAPSDDHRTHDEEGIMYAGYTGIANTLTGQVANNLDLSWNHVLNQIPRDASSAICREGRDAYMNQIYIKAHVNGKINDQFMKMMLVYEREQPALVGTGGGTAAVADPNSVLQNAGTAYQSIAQNRRDNARRFKIVRSWILPIDSDVSGRSSHVIDEFVPLKGKKVTWSLTNTNGGLLDMTEGALYLMVTGSGPAGTVGTPTPVAEVFYTSRLYFSK